MKGRVGCFREATKEGRRGSASCTLPSPCSQGLIWTADIKMSAWPASRGLFPICACGGKHQEIWPVSSAKCFQPCLSPSLPAGLQDTWCCILWTSCPCSLSRFLLPVSPSVCFPIFTGLGRATSSFVLLPFYFSFWVSVLSVLCVSGMSGDSRDLLKPTLCTHTHSFYGK